MERFSLSAFCFLLFTVACLCQNIQPQQLHLALGDDLSRMVAIWATADALPSSQGVSCVVGVQSNSYNLTFGGNSYTYSDGGFKGQMHKVTMKGLKPNTKYFYRCGSSNSFSKVRLSEDDTAGVMSSEFVFTTAPQVSDSASFTAAVIGDMGVKNSNGTFTRLTEDRKANLLDMLVHVGDISYADDYHPSSTNSRIEDEYFQRLQTIAAYFPAMTTVGNHEKQFDFAAYLNRTYMPTISSGSRFWYSFDYLHAHFVAFSTEHPFHPGTVQYNWLKADIEKAAKNRHNVPWIIVFAHRPLYCSALLEAERCTVEAPRYRKYLEDIFHENQVDLYLCGHNHNYERSFPVYKEHATSTDPHTYVNPKATIYIVDGAAGNIELNDPTWMSDIKWRAAHSKGFEFGYARMTITKTSLEWTFFNDKDKSITDQFTIQKV